MDKYDKLMLTLEHVRNMQYEIERQLKNERMFPKKTKVEDFEETITLTGSGVKKNEPLKKKHPSIFIKK